MIPRSRIESIVGLLVALAGPAGCNSKPPLQETEHAALGAEALPDVPGLPNLHRVTPMLYRSAQPSEAGLLRLCRQEPLEPGGLPIRTVLSLRIFQDDEDDAPPGAPLRFEHISFKSWHAEDEDIVRFLRIATTPGLQPLLVHCHYGADRTGTMVAAYRIVVQGWTKEAAVREMTEGGYGFHSIWSGLSDYLMKLDVEKIRSDVAAGGPWK